MDECKIMYELIESKSATHQKTPTQNMTGREDNTDDKKIQRQHKRQAQL